MLHGESKQTIN